MSMCNGKTRKGKRCRCNAVRNGLCALHADPERAKELAALSVASRSRPSVPADGGEPIDVPETYGDVVDSLKGVYARVANGQMDRDTGRVLANLAQAIFAGFKTCGEAEELAKLRDMLAAGPAGIPRPKSGGE